MQFKVDENLPVEASQLFREAGHEAVSVLDQMLGGKPDQEIADVCLKENKALVTLDLDFANINTYPPSNFHGIFVLRLKRQAKPQVLEALRRLIPLLNKEPVEKQLWIVEEERIRIRE